MCVVMFVPLYVCHVCFQRNCCTYVFMYVMSVCRVVCMYGGTCVMYVCMYVCMYACMNTYVCMYACMHVNTYVSM